MNRTPLLILKQDAGEEFKGYSDAYIREINQGRKNCLQILKVNHIIIICCSIVMISKIQGVFPVE